MKIQYKILWFEDEKEYFDNDLNPDTKKLVESKGFIYDCTHRQTGEDLQALLDANTYDLIVSDLNLGGDETGEKLIDYIRNDRHNLTEVLLYSSAESTLENIVKNKGWIERASFCIGVGNLPDKLKRLIELSIRKVEDVNNLRGLVIAETIELEKKIETILCSFFEAAEEVIPKDYKEEIRKSIYNKKLEQSKIQSEIAEQIKLMDVKELVDQDVLTTNNTYEAVQKILKTKLKTVNIQLNTAGITPETRESLQILQTQLDQLKTEFSKFKQEILDIRNVLAHVEEKKDENGKPYLQSLIKGQEPIKFDDKKYIEVRKNLHKHAANLTAIEQHVLNLK